MKIELSMPWLLCLIFVTLKLCGVIDWSWWAVTAPVWGGLLLALAAIALRQIYFERKNRKFKKMLDESLKDLRDKK